MGRRQSQRPAARVVMAERPKLAAQMRASHPVPKPKRPQAWHSPWTDPFAPLGMSAPTWQDLGQGIAPFLIPAPIGPAPVRDEGESWAKWMGDMLAYGMSMPGIGVGPNVGATVYHGTPHRFPPTPRNPLGEFDLSKIGTGEGAQAYGHGIYLADEPKVAREYGKNQSKIFVAPRDILVGGVPYTNRQQLYRASADALAKGNKADAALYGILSMAHERGLDGPVKIARQVNANPVLWGSWDYGREALDSALKRIRTEVQFTPQRGNVYRVDLPDEQIARMLDWDAPLARQPHVTQRLTPEAMGLQPAEHIGQELYRGFLNEQRRPLGMMQRGGTPESFRERWINRLLESPTGQSLYGQLALSPQEASSALGRAGIPGLRYLDQGSRAAGQGTRNYVVWQPEILRILGIEP